MYLKSHANLELKCEEHYKKICLDDSLFTNNHFIWMTSTTKSLGILHYLKKKKKQFPNHQTHVKKAKI